MDDLPSILLREAINGVADMAEAKRIVAKIRDDIYEITRYGRSRRVFFIIVYMEYTLLVLPYTDM